MFNKILNNKFILFSIALISIFIICNPNKNDSSKNSHCVVVILEAKRGKENILKEELLKVKKLSVTENTCLDYRIHEDINNPAQFVLYETWTSQEDHAKQFQKPYIVDFANKANDLLNKPYQFVMAKIVK